MKTSKNIFFAMLTTLSVAFFSSCTETPTIKDLDGNVLLGKVVSYTDTTYQMEFELAKDSSNLKSTISNILKVTYNDIGNIINEKEYYDVNKLSSEVTYQYNEKDRIELKMRNHGSFYSKIYYTYEDSHLIKEDEFVVSGPNDRTPTKEVDRDVRKYYYENGKRVKETYSYYEDDDSIYLAYKFKYNEDGSYSKIKTLDKTWEKTPSKLFEYDTKGRVTKETWRISCSLETTYDEKTGLKKKDRQGDGFFFEETEYTYQFDEQGNWIKRIDHYTQADGTKGWQVTTREIEYAK